MYLKLLLLLVMSYPGPALLLFQTTSIVYFDINLFINYVFSGKLAMHTTLLIECIAPTSLYCEESGWSNTLPINSSTQNIDWVNTSQLQLGLVKLTEMHKWTLEHDPVLHNYCQAKCAHLLKPLGSTTFPIIDLNDSIVNWMPFLEGTHELTKDHNCMAGLYGFKVIGTNDPVYIGSSTNFLRRLNGHVYDYTHPELNRGQSVLYNFIRNLETQNSIQWGVFYQYSDYYSDFRSSVIQSHPDYVVTEYGQGILHAFSQYQACAVEQGVISHYNPKCNGHQNVSLNFLNYHPGMQSIQTGVLVKVFKYENGLDPFIDKPYETYTSVLESSRLTGVIPVPTVQAHMNTLVPRYSPNLDMDICFWRDDLPSRIGQSARISTNAKPMEAIDLESIPVGYYHAYHADTLELYKEYSSKKGIVMEFNTASEDSFSRRLRKWQNTIHTLTLTSTITGAVYSLYFCVNPTTISGLHSAATMLKYKRVILTDLNTGTETEFPSIGAAEKSFNSGKKIGLSKYIKSRGTIWGRYKIRHA